MDRLTVKPGYESLAAVLDDALYQAQSGKGEERHANQLPFDQQPMQRLIQAYGVGFALGQAAKKGEEAQKLEPGHDIAELLGAIVYLSGAIVSLQRKYGKIEAPAAPPREHTVNEKALRRPTVALSKCLVCGKAGGHGGLPCPDTSPMCNDVPAYDGHD